MANEDAATETAEAAAVPRIWMLLGTRRGDNNQLLALAERLGLPFETRTIGYNLLRVLKGRLLGASRISALSGARRHIAPPWPDLVIGTGWRSVPLSLWIRKASGGRAKIVRLGDPRVDPALFDLVITTNQYAIADAPNVHRLPIAMSRHRSQVQPSADECGWLGALPRPHLLLAIGGAAKYWRLTPERVRQAVETLSARAAEAGGSLILVGSPRTGARVLDRARKAASDEANCALAPGAVRFPVLLQDADEIFVTGDSIAMLSEAVSSGRPVGLVPVELSGRGRRALGGRIRDSDRRDLRRFWSYLQDRGLIGTMERPSTAQIEDPAAEAAAAVLALLGDGG